MVRDVDFLARHTRSVIELYANGSRDLEQTLVELEDNQHLGLSGSVVHEILTDTINYFISGKSGKEGERLVVLRSRLMIT